MDKPRANELCGGWTATDDRRRSASHRAQRRLARQRPCRDDHRRNGVGSPHRRRVEWRSAKAAASRCAAMLRGMKNVSATVRRWSTRRRRQRLSGDGQRRPSREAPSGTASQRRSTTAVRLERAAGAATWSLPDATDARGSTPGLINHRSRRRTDPARPPLRQVGPRRP